MNGMTDDKPLSVPRDIDLRLDTSPITAVDALGNPHSLSSSTLPVHPLLPLHAGPRRHGTRHRPGPGTLGHARDPTQVPTEQ